MVSSKETGGRDDLHGHWCGKCGRYWDCKNKGKPCIRKVYDKTDRKYYAQTVPEVTQAFGCSQCT